MRFAKLSCGRQTEPTNEIPHLVGGRRFVWVSAKPIVNIVREIHSAIFPFFADEFYGITSIPEHVAEENAFVQHADRELDILRRICVEVFLCLPEAAPWSLAIYGYSEIAARLDE